MPITHSPMPTFLDGPEPDFVYCAMFLSSSTKYFMASSWPLSCTMVLMISFAVPAVFGLDIQIKPLYSGLSRSSQPLGASTPRRFSSSVLTIKPRMPL